MAKYQKKNLPVVATPGLKKVIIKRNENSTDYEIVDNNKKINLNFLHQIVISDKKKDTNDNKLDFSTAKVVGFYNKSFDTVANFLGENNIFNLKNVEYHEEEVIFDIDNPSNEDQMVSFDGTPLIEIIDGDDNSQKNDKDKKEKKPNEENESSKNNKPSSNPQTSKDSDSKTTVKIIKH